MKTKNTNLLTMWFPGKIWNTFYQSYAAESIDEAIYSSPYRRDIKIYHKEDRIQISLATLQSCFQSTVDCLLLLLDTVFKTNTSSNVRDIIIVGELAESKIIQTTVQNHFPSTKIHVPVLPNVAIVKGAVLIGHAPEIIGRTISSKSLSINEYLAVVAIDFGTANSGFAFSTKDRYKECPLNISLMKIRKTTDPKTTSILLDEGTRFVEFGKKAQDKYAQIQTSDKKDTYYYFENFKMMLYNSKIPLRKLRIMDIQENPNKTVLAQDVVASAIKALSGTTDITVHEKLHSGIIKEINKASGEGCGGRSVDAAFFRKLDDIFGKDLMKRLKLEKPKAFLDLHRHFEDLKRRVSCENTDDDAIKFPCQITKEWLGSDSATEDLARSKDFEIRDGKLILPHNTLIEIFKPTISAIIKKIKKALRFDTSNEVSIIILVGGFAKNDLLRNEIEINFNLKRIITPPDANLAVLKGAVLYGHKPESVDPRVTRYTYGVEATIPFDPQVHEEHRKFMDESCIARCRGVFSLIIRANETVKLGTTIRRVYKIPSLSNEIDIQIFATEKGLPMYTNKEGCRKNWNTDSLHSTTV
ncbi:unnamed protein product [Mytilus coruscus]|uniref:Uncharacterized protein n=1 Tax=Mytilus coruscus TaxID=42192 RepID=A0A6J8C4I3_MYTCO|nr:unnamed protein product [Mytilus coruscus]